MSDSSSTPPRFLHPDLFAGADTPLDGTRDSVTAFAAVAPPAAPCPCRNAGCREVAASPEGYCAGCHINTLKLWFSGLVFAWDTNAAADARHLRHDAFA